ncbi:MAG: 16S rRNA processing protein RimM [Sphingomonadales bacterium]|nr:16S rRNA processing protein RimM [Sphingomonadales bacterium]
MSSQAKTPKQTHKPTETWVCVGALGVPHGVRGDIKIRSFTEDKDSLANFDTLYVEPNYAPLKLKVKFPNKDGFVASVEGITDRDQADVVKGRKLYVKREQLPETDGDDYYITDLVGLKVIDIDDNAVGIIKAVHNFGAGDVLEVQLNEPKKPVGREVMIPFKESFVPKVDVAGGVVKVDLLGWLATLKESTQKQSDQKQHTKGNE